MRHYQIFIPTSLECIEPDQQTCCMDLTNHTFFLMDKADLLGQIGSLLINHAISRSDEVTDHPSEVLGMMTMLAHAQG